MRRLDTRPCDGARPCDPRPALRAYLAFASALRFAARLESGDQHTRDFDFIEISWKSQAVAKLLRSRDETLRADST